MTEENQKPITLKKAVEVAIKSYKVGEQFHGNNLKQKVVALYPKARNCYVDTILREARDVARECYKCVDRRKSLYERLQG